MLERSPLVAVVGFAAGIAVMFGFRAASEHLEHRREAAGHAGLPIGLVVAIGVDFFIDGLILGAGFASAAARRGPAHRGADRRVPLRRAVAVGHAGGTVSRRFVAFAPVVLALLTVAGTAVGVATLSGASPTLLAGVLAFGAVAFMYLATEELLVEAHAKGETSIGSVGFFVGFLIYLVLSELVG